MTSFFRLVKIDPLLGFWKWIVLITSSLDGLFSQVEIDVITSSLIDVYTVVDEPVKYLKIIFNF